MLKRAELKISKIGDVAEAVLMSSYTYMGRNPVHVAHLFDGCGYDIELQGKPVERIEAKAASERTRGRFRLTRNEFEKAKVYGEEWTVVQVILSNAAFVSDRIESHHVVEIIKISCADVVSLVPTDPEGFRWAESAEIVPPANAWETADLSLDPTFSVTGFN